MKKKLEIVELKCASFVINAKTEQILGGYCRTRHAVANT